MTQFTLEFGQTYDDDYSLIEMRLASSQLSKAHVDKILNQIDTDADRLVANPELGERLEAKTRIPNDYRYLVSGYYVQLYLVDMESQTVRLLHIVDGRSDYMHNLGLS